MGRPLPPSSPFISPIPSQQPPTDLPISFLSYLFVIYFIVSWIYLLSEIIRRRLFLDSREQVHDPDPDPDPTPTDTTIIAANSLELFKSDHLIIYIDDSPSSSPDAEASPSDKLISCPICWEEAAEEEVRVLPRCRHAYHKACIDLWLVMGSQSCPVCRDRLTVRLVKR